VRLSYTFYSTLLLGLGSYTCAQLGAFNVPRTPFKEPRISCAWDIHDLKVVKASNDLIVLERPGPRVYHSRRLKVVEKVRRPPELPVDTLGEPSVSDLCWTIWSTRIERVLSHLQTTEFAINKSVVDWPTHEWQWSDKQIQAWHRPRRAVVVTNSTLEFSKSIPKWRVVTNSTQEFSNRYWNDVLQTVHGLGLCKINKGPGSVKNTRILQ
jgi:hypothetical protein